MCIHVCVHEHVSQNHRMLGLSGISAMIYSSTVPDSVLLNSRCVTPRPLVRQERTGHVSVFVSEAR